MDADGNQRRFGTSFESSNLGKTSAVCDFRVPADRKRFDELLAGADVLITNTRPESLARLNLSQSAICEAHPQLIYLAMSAWGRLGEDAQLPGYDLGAFWASTGLAASINSPGHYFSYPIGFGDVTTSAMMVGAVCNALQRRLVTGRGGPIDAALQRTAAFCLGPVLVCDEARDDDLQSGELLLGRDAAIGDQLPDFTRPEPINPLHAW